MSYTRTIGGTGLRAMSLVALSLVGACASSAVETRPGYASRGETVSGGAPWNTSSPNPTMAEQGYSRASNSGTGIGRMMAENGLREDQAVNDRPAMRARVSVGAAEGAEPAVATSASTVGDERALALLSVLDRAAIEQSRLATARATSENLRWFATASVTRHTTSMERAGDLSRRLNLAPRMDERATQVAENAVLLQQELWGLRGASFERAYVQAQVAQQERVLQLIDQALLPNEVRVPELRTALQYEVRPLAVTELQQARALEAELSR